MAGRPLTEAPGFADYVSRKWELGLHRESARSRRHRTTDYQRQRGVERQALPNVHQDLAQHESSRLG